MEQRSVPLSPERYRDGRGSQFSSVVRSQNDGRVEAVKRRVSDALVPIDQRHALAAVGTDEPVAVLLLGAVPALVAFRAFTALK